MDRVGEERDTSRKDDDDNLKYGGGRQADERPFDRPNATLCGEEYGVYRAVRVIMAVIWITMVMRMTNIKHTKIILLGMTICDSHDVGKTRSSVFIAGYPDGYSAFNPLVKHRQQHQS